MNTHEPATPYNKKRNDDLSCIPLQFSMANLFIPNLPLRLPVSMKETPRRRIRLRRLYMKFTDKLGNKVVGGVKGVSSMSDIFFMLTL
jgi:hypothetical protein